MIEENRNENLMDATFQEEEQLVGEDNPDNLSGVTDLLNQNGVDLNNISELSGLSDFQQGFATSSMNNTLPRRCSERQASKRNSNCSRITKP